MGNLSGNRVVGGPFDVLLSTTTIGHTKEGARVLVNQTYGRLHSHESGEAPLRIFPRGGRRFRLEVAMLEITAANLALLCHDVSATTDTVVFQSSKVADALPSYTNVKLVQKNASGVDTTMALKHAVPVTEEFEFVGRQEDDATWVLNVAFEGLYVDSATLAQIDQSGIGA